MPRKRVLRETSKLLSAFAKTSGFDLFIYLFIEINSVKQIKCCDKR